jgi:uncharacterized membrane-anchored protein
MRYFIILAFMLFSTMLFANTDPEMDAFFERIDSEIIYGPNSVDVGGIAVLELEYGQAFLNKKHLSELFTIIGKESKSPFFGWVIPGTPGDDEENNDANDDNWSVINIEIADIGHISANGDESWDYDRLLKNITETQNKSGNQVLKWVEFPNYKRLQHKLNWSYEVKNANEEYFDVYQNMIFGRSSILTLSSISRSRNRDNQLTMTRKLTDTATFTHGNRYKDYQSGIDKESSLTLAALVGGSLAAKKLGLIALVLALFAKFGKFIALAIGCLAILVGFIRKREK